MVLGLEGSCAVGGVAAVGGGLLSLGGAEGGIFHRITMTSMTGAWYLTISNFEAIIVGLVILEIFVLRYLLILPLDFSKWIQHGILLQTAVSRRRRRRHTHPLSRTSVSNSQQGLVGKELEDATQLMDTMITAVRRLDKDDCLLKALCELEKERQGSGCGSPSPPLIPTPVIRTLTFLRGWGEKGPSLKFPSLVMSQLTSAIHHGGSFGEEKATNSSGGCGDHYPKCPLSPPEIRVGLQLYFSVLNEEEQ